LLDFGVETQWLIRDPDYFTTLAFVSLMENGERDFYFNRGADARLSIPDLDRLDLNEFSIVHFGSATAFLPGPLQETYAHLLRLAGQTDRLISFDPNYRHLLYKDRQEDYTRQCWQFLESCHFCKLSDEEAMLVTGCRNVEESLAVLLSRTNAVYAITLGKSGTLLGCSEKTGLVPSIPVVPVDTTGAGDAFVGAVLFQLSSRKPGEVRDMSFEDWQLVVARGNKAGARTCEYLGAMEAFRHLSDQIFN
jgi:fructokinase